MTSSARIAVGLLLLLGMTPVPARAATCTTVPAFPGEDAPREVKAAWMATGAAGAGLPGELPVMGALAESGLQNLAAGGTDNAGYFQMRPSIWDAGAYAGFQDDPALQLRWFLDHARAERDERTARGLSITDPAHYGEWVADVLVPPAQFRYRYQLRLAEAAALIAAGCPAAAAPPPAPPAPPPDTQPPALALGGPRRAGPRARTITVRVRCPAEACDVTARARLSVGGRRRPHVLRPESASAAAGEPVVLRLRLPARVRRLLAAGRRVRARVKVTAFDAAGNRVVARRTVRLG